MVFFAFDGLMILVALIRSVAVGRFTALWVYVCLIALWLWLSYPVFYNNVGIVLVIVQKFWLSFWGTSA